MRARAAAFLAPVLLATGCPGRPAAPLAPGGSAGVREAVGRAVGFLVARQASDGAWRSTTYGAMRDGPSLTPLVAKFLAYVPPRGEAHAAAAAAGRAYLARLTEDPSVAQGTLPLLYPAYSAALSSLALGDDAGTADAAAAWRSCLRRHRCGAENGWRPDDLQYGGWGYSPRIPVRPDHPEGLPVEANLSATLFAVGALRRAGATPADPAIREALGFVRRCQNLPAEGTLTDPVFDDGGFFLGPCDPARNKAGTAGRDGAGRERFGSYGSATCDGIRALLLCGEPPGSPRMGAAVRWLTSNFEADRHPGRFPADREYLRDATYYYYAWSLAHATRLLERDRIVPGPVLSRWRTALTAALLARQDPDGSWVNRFTDSKEDDPLVATPLAAAALTVLSE